jgi:hypothetical protein
MKIKEIFDEIAVESGTNEKMNILSKYKDNKLLKRVLYLANSKRVKFYIKQIPTYTADVERPESLEWALDGLVALSTRQFTGHKAINWLKVLLSSISAGDAYVLERIIEKDLRIGMGTRNINKVFPDLIEKTPYMGAKSYTEKLVRDLFKNGKAVYSDIKMDGRYQNAIINEGDVELISRQGEPTPVGDALFLNELKDFPNVVLNGELTIDGLDRYSANGIIASIVDIEGKRDTRSADETLIKISGFEKKHGHYYSYMDKIVYTVWDMIYLDEYFNPDKVKSERQYKFRRYELRNLINTWKFKMIRSVESKIVNSYEEAVQHFQEALNRGLEGTIIKSMDGQWKDTKPNWQVKMKLEINVDLKITGFNYGTGKNSNVVSSLSCESSCGQIKTRPTGIDEDMMQHITDNQDNLLGTILEVKCSGLSKDANNNYSLLHPVFKVLRDDKLEANSLEEIIEIENAAKKLS